MTSKTYRVVLRLRSPMHIGQMKLGNVQRTRPYVTGRVLWGALTERLTRDRFYGQGPATQFSQYDAVGREVHTYLAFTYFYPTIDRSGAVDLWPWEDGFRTRFLSTYASTALAYPQQSADEGTLHEVECIAPHTLDTGAPVYLAGYVFERDGAPDWQSALQRLQLGGERGYGWGRVEPADDSPPPWDNNSNGPLFGWYTIEPDTWPPVLTARGKDDDESVPLLAHAMAEGFDQEPKVVDGPVEPLVGRETHPDDGRFGVWVTPACICYVPGSIVPAGTRMQIGPYGIWERCPERRPERDEGPVEGALSDATP